MANSTSASAYDLPPLPSYTTQPQPPLVHGLPDQLLTLLLPIIAYWSTSMLFHLVDTYDLFPQYRLHTPAEVLKRNHVSRWDVFRDVVIQQVLQTILGLALALVDETPMCGREQYDVAVWARRLRMAQRALPTLLGFVGLDAAGLAKNMHGSHAMLAGALSGGLYPELSQTIVLSGQPTIAPAFASWELLAAKAIYHVGIPFFQFVLAICVVDTWQYFLHRAMHMNKYLYITFHSRHHRLYVPYAYGALYNHPFEGFLLDTLGTGIAYLASGMTVRQSMWFFTCTTIKTVDDHCGYAFPWDPLQHLTSNNAGYHDVHHQSWGIKTNFSQPFFTFWDAFLGTKWVGGDVSARYEKAKMAAQKKVDAEVSAVKPITGSRPEESLRSNKAMLAPDYGSSTARPVSPVSENRVPIIKEPRIPPGKATQQAAASRRQVLEDRAGGGPGVLVEESIEEVKAQKAVRTRRRTASSGLKGFADRMSESLHGKGTGVLGVESRSR